LYQFLLQSSDHVKWSFLVASMGVSGLEMASLWAPDVILLDYRLPDMLGLEFLRRLEEPIPVIMMTGYEDVGVAVDAMKLGALDYLTKDRVNKEELEASVLAGLLRAETIKQEAGYRLHSKLMKVMASEQLLCKAMPQILAAMCETFRWDLACWWRSNGEGEFECAAMQAHTDTWRRYGDLLARTRPRTGEGMLGGALQRGRPVWVSVDTADGKCQAVACAVPSGDGQADVIAGYGRWLDLTNENTTGTLADAAAQIGQYVRRVESVQALQTREHDLSNSFDNAPTGICWISSKGEILRTNRGLAEMLGYEMELLPGRNIGEFVTGCDEFLARLQKGETLFNGQTAVRTNSGKVRHVLINANGHFQHGRFVHSRAFIRDVTDLKEAEDKLRRTAEDLERSNEDLQQFAYVASHDLKEPLRMIASFAGLLERHLEGKLDETGREFLDHVLGGVNRMQLLIDGLLHYCRIRNSPAELVPVDTEKVFRQSITNLHVAITESGAQVTHDALPTVTGDANQLTQLLQNLIANAVKFRGERNPEVHVGVKRVGDEWVWSVSDNGIGIPGKEFERVFKMFQRLHVRSRYPGTGIGLAICRQVVERHGGRIWVESEEGKGTTIYFTLPLAPETQVSTH